MDSKRIISNDNDNDNDNNHNEEGSMKKVAPIDSAPITTTATTTTEKDNLSAMEQGGLTAAGGTATITEQPTSATTSRRKALFCGLFLLLLLITGIVAGTILGLRVTSKSSSTTASSAESLTSAPPTMAPTSPPTMAPIIIITEEPVVDTVDTPTTTTTVITPTEEPQDEQQQQQDDDDDDSCSINVNVQCIPPAGFEDCDSLVAPRTQCTQRPTSLTYRYSGGDCSESSNMLPADTFPCIDENGSPTTLESHGYVVVTDSLNDDEIIYHRSFLLPGDEFTIEQIDDTPLPDLMTITIYSPLNGMTTVLQTNFIDISCNANAMFLNSHFGAMQLISYTNEEQGVVDSTVTATLVYTATGETAILTDLTSITNAVNQFEDGFINLSDDVVTGMELNANDENVFSNDDEDLAVIELTVDLSQSSKPVTIYTIAQAQSPMGYECRGVHFLSFTPLFGGRRRTNERREPLFDMMLEEASS